MICPARRPSARLCRSAHGPGRIHEKEHRMRHCTHVLRRFVILLTVLAGGPLFAATVQPTGHAVDGEVLVKIQPAASQADVATIRQLGDVDDGEKIASTRSGTIWRMHSRFSL